MLWTALERHRDLGLLIARIGFGGGIHLVPRLAEADGRVGTIGGLWHCHGEFRHLVRAEVVGSGCRPGGVARWPLDSPWSLSSFRRLVLAFVMVVATTNHIATGQGNKRHAFKNAWLFTAWRWSGQAADLNDLLASPGPSVPALQSSLRRCGVEDNGASGVCRGREKKPDRHGSGTPKGSHASWQ